VPRFEEVGELLRAARNKLALSQEDFASALGVKLSRLQKWETGINEPRFTIPELRRLRSLNREVFDALISGFLLQHVRFPEPQLTTSRPDRAEPSRAQDGKLRGLSPIPGKRAR
jgi:transcriptional regulator with XRE-family HTH domain